MGEGRRRLPREFESQWGAPGPGPVADVMGAVLVAPFLRIEGAAQAPRAAGVEVTDLKTPAHRLISL